MRRRRYLFGKKVRDSYNYTQIEIEHHYKHRERETEKTNNKTDKHYH